MDVKSQSRESSLTLSVITPCLNAYKTIKDTISSVRDVNKCMEANGMKIEHILVDGGSTDGTLNLAKDHIKNYPYLRIVQDQGKGIYAAMNAGIREAKGKYSHILNADDMILDPEKYTKLLIRGVRQEVDVLICSIVYFKRPFKKPKGKWIAKTISQKAGEWQKKIRRGLHYPHPGFIATTELHKTELFDTKYNLSADYKFMQSILLKKGINENTLISKEVLIGMAEGGASSGFMARLKGAQQIRQINRELGINSLGLVRYLRKIPRLLPRHSWKENIPSYNWPQNFYD